MDPTKKLIVPEINAAELTKEDKIVANLTALPFKWF
jgi:aspartate-semialdehyde dehydrogenase